MYKSFAVAAAVACEAARALSTTQLDVAALYGGLQLAQTSSSSKVEAPGFPAHQKVDPLCLMQVHTVRPNLDVPKLPPVSHAAGINQQNMDQLPPALRRRLQRRYEQRGMEVPAYLRTEAADEPPSLAAPPQLRGPEPKAEPRRPEPSYRAVAEPARSMHPPAPQPYERQVVAPPPAPVPQPQPQAPTLGLPRVDGKGALAGLVQGAVSHQGGLDLSAPSIPDFGGAAFNSNAVLSKGQYDAMLGKGRLSSAEQLLVGLGYKEDQNPFGLGPNAGHPFAGGDLEVGQKGDLDRSKSMNVPGLAGLMDKDFSIGEDHGPKMKAPALDFDLDLGLEDVVPAPGAKAECPLAALQATGGAGCPFAAAASAAAANIKDVRPPVVEKRPAFDFGAGFATDFGDDGDLDLGFDLSHYMGGQDGPGAALEAPRMDFAPAAPAPAPPMQHPGPKAPADDCPLKLKAQIPNIPEQVAEAECALAKAAAEKRAPIVPEPEKPSECPLAMTSAIVFDGPEPVKVCTLKKGGAEPPILSAPEPPLGSPCGSDGCPLEMIAELDKFSFQDEPQRPVHEEHHHQMHEPEIMP